MTKKEILGQLIRQESRKYEDEQLKHPLPKLEEDPAWILLQSPIKWGIKDTSTTVDKYLYH